MTKTSIAVLLVEDNAGDARLILELLRDQPGGFTLERVDRLSWALERLAGAAVDLVLLDLGLPDSQGRETYASLRERAPHVPIIILTGLEDESLAMRLMREGAQDYLVKGTLDGALLGRAIRYAIERHGSELEIRHLNERLEARVGERTRQLEAAVMEVRRRERELQDHLDAMATFSAKLAPDGRILVLNRSALKALGLSPAQARECSLLDGPWWAHDPMVQRRVREAFAQATAGLPVSYEERLWSLGRLTTIIFSLVPVQSADGTLAYIVAEGRDITRRVEAETALQAANRELEAFTYSVSHDLRAPLRQVDGFARILAESMGDDLRPEARHALMRIQEGASHMGRLVDDLLALAHVGQQSPRLTEIPLAEVVQDVIERMAPESEGREVEWRIGELPKVSCDPGLMRIAYTNLISNAIKYTRPRPRATIEIGCRREGGPPILYVRDNGVGFNMKYADKLFGVFQRLHRPEEFEGTGVGLATVQRIVRNHGGRIWVDAAPGEGATFYFTLGAAGGAVALAVP
jgi:PAS domain S-box-containing protein